MDAYGVRHLFAYRYGVILSGDIERKHIAERRPTRDMNWCSGRKSDLVDVGQELLPLVGDLRDRDILSDAGLGKPDRTVLEHRVYRIPVWTGRRVTERHVDLVRDVDGDVVLELT